MMTTVFKTNLRSDPMSKATRRETNGTNPTATGHQTERPSSTETHSQFAGEAKRLHQRDAGLSDHWAAHAHGPRLHAVRLRMATGAFADAVHWTGQVEGLSHDELQQAIEAAAAA